MFVNVLVANRGEIALRIMSTCRAMGIDCTAVYTDEDEKLPHVRFADHRVPLGPDPYAYLDRELLMEACRRAGADALHPGYGFLAEDAALSEQCAKHQIEFIGPPAELMRKMGSKLSAREHMSSRGIVSLPASGPLDSPESALAEAERIGYPVIVKASGGGGGRGMRVCHNPDALTAGFGPARDEAQRYFGDPTLYVEKYLVRPRHIEVQVTVDKAGHAAHFWERMCSLQRRHQKLVEEAPAVVLEDEPRRELCERAAKSVEGLTGLNAATLEFLFPSHPVPDGEPACYFIEANTRIQVEHPVTEMVTGVDLIREQLRIAAGEPVAETPPLRGTAIEFRINVEDPVNAFAPGTGRITSYRLPSGAGLRADHFLSPGLEVTGTYDALLAKLIVWGSDRDEALRRARSALAETEVAGVPTNIPFHSFVVSSLAFREGFYDTGYVEAHAELLNSWLDEWGLPPGLDGYETPGATAQNATATSGLTPWRRRGVEELMDSRATALAGPRGWGRKA
ncbi:MAG TPA: biotin carboxylase N-terminal domain-containing protein [Thermoplasmata archaeon]|nr:biotin carboxylase N-terminal domain-containing protein [Thermoplasmata archaeon]